jgi:hypothetical protein
MPDSATRPNVECFGAHKRAKKKVVGLLPRSFFDGKAAAMKKANSKMAAKADNKVKTDYENAPVAFTKSERKEIIADARTYCKAAGVRLTPARIRQVILDNHGPAVAKAVCGNKAARKAAAKRGTVRKTKKIVRLVFGFSVAAVARSLGRAGVMPSDAIAAIHSHQPKASPFAIRTYVQAGRAGLRGAPAKLTAQQLKSLKAA